MLLCFFFQAEDGIRDSPVTGVQTCALPICDVYTGLDTATLSENNFDYAQTHLRILSGLYGLLDRKSVV